GWLLSPPRMPSESVPTKSPSRPPPRSPAIPGRLGESRGGFLLLLAHRRDRWPQSPALGTSTVIPAVAATRAAAGPNRTAAPPCVRAARSQPAAPVLLRARTAALPGDQEPAVTDS